MLETAFQWQDIPAGERFARWREVAAASHALTDMSSDHERDYRGSLRALELGPIQVTELQSPSLRTLRTPRLIRRSDPELYFLSFFQDGGGVLTHGGRETVLHAGDLVLTKTSLPHAARVGGSRGATALVDTVFPRSLLPLPAHSADRMLAVRLSGRHGPGALLAQFLTQLASDTTQYHAADANRLGAVILDLAATLITHHLGTATRPESHQHALYLRIQAFIRQHLRDPDLTPAKVAAAHHISARSLHRLFRHHGTTTAAFIRRERISRARRDLADPRLSTQSIHAIAARSGFLRPADFTRAFRAAYGIPPSAYRHAIHPRAGS